MISGRTSAGPRQRARTSAVSRTAASTATSAGVAGRSTTAAPVSTGSGVPDTVLDTGRTPAGRHDLHLHPAPAVRAEPGWLQLPGRHARRVVTLGGRPAAPVTPHQHRHRVAESALTGIFS